MSNPSPLESIFFAALEKRSSAERASFLDDACAGSVELRGSVERMLAAQAEAGSFLERPVPLPDETIDRPGREQPGAVIGPYKLLQQIGEGGMGVVFMAEQLHPVQRKVALKIIKPGMDSRPIIARFEAERQALAIMDHPNIARVLDAGTTEFGRPYFVMELVSGLPITTYCDDLHVSLKKRLELFIPVCQAVQHAHQKGIIHRDLKPTNVMIASYDGKPVPKVIDFGVAKAAGLRLTEQTLFTEFGQIVGTIDYMSPEQAGLNQLDIDTRSDIYSLGVLLYELLTGTTPLERTRMKEVAVLEMLRLVREEEPPSPSARLSTTEALPSIAANRGLEPKKLSGLVSGELDWIAMKCLAKNREDRYASAADLVADFERWLRDEPVSVHAPDLTYLLRIWLRRNVGSGGWAIALGAIWGIVGGVTCWLVMLNPLDVTVGLRRAIYLLGVAILTSSGLITVGLVRPKNTTADLVTGAISGAVAAVVCYTISWGWVAVLIAGVPYGIWLGMGIALILMSSISLIGTLAAGSLVRRHGAIHRVIRPYVELTLPAILAVVFASGLVFKLATNRSAGSQYFLFPTVALTLAWIGVRQNWHWLLRGALYAASLASLWMFASKYVQ